MIRFTCPDCETTLKAAEEKVGTKIPCPRCKTKVQVPGPVGKKKKKPDPDDEDDFEEDDEPRKGKKREEQKSSSVGVYVAIAVAAVVVVGGVGAVVAYKMMSKGNTETASTGGSGTPPPPPSGGPPPGPGSTPPPPGTAADASKQTGDAKKGNTGEAGKTASDATKTSADPSKTTPIDSGVVSGGVDQEKIYAHVLKSTVWIFGYKKSSGVLSAWSGSGSLVDREDFLVLTNDHVIEGSGGDGDTEFRVFFPRYRNDELVKDKSEYQRLLREGDGIAAYAKNRKPAKDLALLKLTGVPDKAQALPIAGRSARTAEKVFGVGNSGLSDGLWSFMPGDVRNSYRGYTVEGVKYLPEARIVEATVPTYHGDSGGPVVNSRGQLVMVTQGGVPGKPANWFIDVSEVRELLNEYYKSNGLSKVLIADSAAGGIDTGNVADLLKLLGEKDARKRVQSVHALGQLADGARPAIPELIKLLKDEDDDVRRSVAAALPAIGGLNRTHVKDLAEALKDKDGDVRSGIASALARMGLEARAAVPVLADALVKDTNPEVRLKAANALMKIGREALPALAALTEALKDPETDVRNAAVTALQKIGPAAKTALPAMLDILKETSNKDLQFNVMSAIEAIGPAGKDAVPELGRLLRNKDREVQFKAMTTLGAIGPEAKDSVKYLIAILEVAYLIPKNNQLVEDKNAKDLRNAAVEALGKIGKEAVPDLTKKITDSNVFVRIGCCEALGQIGPDATPALDALKRRAKLDKAGEVREAAINAIRRIESK